MKKEEKIVLKPKTNVVAIVFIVLFALAFIFGIALLVFAENPPHKEGVVLYSVNNVKELEERLSLYEFYPGYPYTVEPYLLKSLPKGFAKLPYKVRKKLFIKIMLPIALTVKQEFDREHAIFEEIKNKIIKGEKLTPAEHRILLYGLKKFRCKNINELVKRAGSVPISLLIAQAAIESGWGSSRFAIYYNNIYGIHRKDPKPGNIVKRFSSLYAATIFYVLTLDRNPAYKKFREARYRMGHYPNPYKLAEYLTMYSTKRKEYIRLVQRVMLSNNLVFYDKLSPFNSMMAESNNLPLPSIQ